MTSTNPPADLDLLRLFLARRDAPCPQCDYNLRNLAGDRYPECGEPLVLRVNVSEPKQAWLITGLIGLSAGAGFNALLLLYMAVQLLLNRGTSGMDELINSIGLIAMSAFIAAYLRAWRKLRRKPAAIRIATAAGCWALAVADLLIFAVKIR